MSEASVVSAERLPSAVVIHVLAAELHKTEVDAICAAVDAQQTPNPALPFILDMSKVAFMGSLAMGVLIGLNKEFLHRRQRLIFVGFQQNVLKALTVTKMNTMMTIAPDLEAAKKTATL